MKPNWRRMGRMIYQTGAVTTALILAAIVFLRFITYPQINGYYRAMFPHMIYGQAYRPFVTRALLPALVNWTTAILPPEWRSAIIASDFRLSYSWEQEFLPEYIIASTWMYLSLVGFFFALKYLLKGLYELSQVFTDVISLLALAALPLFFSYYSYIYDLPLLFLFTLGLGLMLRRKWTAYLVLFLLATINKETSILLTLVFAIYFFHKSELIEPKKFWQILASQVVVFLLVRGGISLVFRNNPGVFLEYHLFDHNLGLFYQRPSIMVIAIVMPLLFLIFFKWTEKPAFARIGFWAVFLFLLSATLFFGFLDEYRDYYEAYPLFVALAAHTIAKLFRLPIKSTMRTT